MNALILVATLLSADPIPEKSAQLSFAELKYLLPQSDPKSAPVVTPSLRQYLDRSIRIRGYMLPHSVLYEKTRQFILVSDNEQYMSPRAPEVSVGVLFHGKNEVSFTQMPLTIEGKLRHREHKLADGTFL